MHQRALPRVLESGLLVVADQAFCVCTTWADGRHGRLLVCHRCSDRSLAWVVAEKSVMACSCKACSHECRLELFAGAKSDPSDLVDKFNLPEASRRMIRKVQLAELSITGTPQPDQRLWMVLAGMPHILRCQKVWLACSLQRYAPLPCAEVSAVK